MTEGRRIDGEGVWWAREDVERLKGLRRAGYACRSSGGTGGAEDSEEVFLDVALLKAFLKDANDGFFEKVVVRDV